MLPAIDLNGSSHRRTPHRCGACVAAVTVILLQYPSVKSSKLDASEPYSFPSDRDSFLCPEIFDIPVAGIEAAGEPDRVGGNIGWGASYNQRYPPPDLDHSALTCQYHPARSENQNPSARSVVPATRDANRPRAQHQQRE